MSKSSFLFYVLLALLASNSMAGEPPEGSHAWICPSYHGVSSLMLIPSSQFVTDSKVSVNCQTKAMINPKQRTFLFQPLHCRWIMLLPVAGNKKEPNRCMENEYVGGIAKLTSGLKLRCCGAKKHGFRLCHKRSSKTFTVDSTKSFELKMENGFLQSMEYRNSRWIIKSCGMPHLNDLTLDSELRNEEGITVFDNQHTASTSKRSAEGERKLFLGFRSYADHGHRQNQHRIVSRSGPRERTDSSPMQRSAYESNDFPVHEVNQAALLKTLPQSLGQSITAPRMFKRQANDDLIGSLLYSIMIEAVDKDFTEQEVPVFKTDLDLLEEHADRVEPQAGMEYISLNAELAMGGIDDQPLPETEKPASSKPGRWKSNGTDGMTQSGCTHGSTLSTG